MVGCCAPAGDAKHQWGHLALRRLLAKERVGGQFSGPKASIVCQYSSLGSLTEKWLREDFFRTLSAESSGAGVLYLCEAVVPLTLGFPRFRILLVFHKSSIEAVSAGIVRFPHLTIQECVPEGRASNLLTLKHTRPRIRILHFKG